MYKMKVINYINILNYDTSGTCDELRRENVQC